MTNEASPKQNLGKKNSLRSGLHIVRYVAHQNYTKFDPNFPPNSNLDTLSEKITELTRLENVLINYSPKNQQNERSRLNLLKYSEFEKLIPIVGHLAREKAYEEIGGNIPKLYEGSTYTASAVSTIPWGSNGSIGIALRPDEKTQEKYTSERQILFESVAWLAGLNSDQFFPAPIQPDIPLVVFGKSVPKYVIEECSLALSTNLPMAFNLEPAFRKPQPTN